MAAGLPFKRCDEPYTLLHLINSTISRRAAFVLSAQKASLDIALQRDAKPAADTSAAPSGQEGHAGGPAGGPADPRDSGAAPESGDRAMKTTGGAQQSAVSGAEAAAVETPRPDVGEQVGLLTVFNATCSMLVLGCVVDPLHAVSRAVCRIYKL